MPRDRQVAFHLPPPRPLARVLPHLVAVDERLEPANWWPERALERSTLFHTLAGHVTFAVADRSVRVGAGSLVAIARGARFTERTEAGTWWHARYLMLDGPLVDGLQRELVASGGLAAYVAAPPAWTSALSAAVRLSLGEPPGWPLAVLHHLAGLVHALAAHPPPNAAATLAERVARAVDDAPAQPWPVARLARVAGLGVHAFAHRFCAEVGVPPARWVRERRLDIAARLVREGLPLADIASRTGFCDAFHLSRCYAARFGAAPSRHRRTARGALHG